MAQARPKTRLSSGDRSAYFARREAAKVLGTVLEGDARRRAVGSIKSLIYKPSIRNKKATFALVCQTLKRMFINVTTKSHLSCHIYKCLFLCLFVCLFSDLPIIKDVLDSATILKGKWKV